MYAVLQLELRAARDRLGDRGADPLYVVLMNAGEEIAP
jgi:hypothetical protein